MHALAKAGGEGRGVFGAPVAVRAGIGGPDTPRGHHLRRRHAWVLQKAIEPDLARTVPAHRTQADAGLASAGHAGP
jgi:hypothetical protein